jgi:hypothetical protein
MPIFIYIKSQVNLQKQAFSVHIYVVYMQIKTAVLGAKKF